jgi:DNA-binding transcriptional LysR family regulator
MGQCSAITRVSAFDATSALLSTDRDADRRVQLSEGTIAAASTHASILWCFRSQPWLRSNLELRHLRYFIAVAESHSFRTAAERLSVTQPAITRQIQDLEAELGIALFLRVPAGVVLTPAGELFLREVRVAFSVISAASHSARRIAAGLEGNLRIGFVEHTGGDGLVPEVFAKFLSETPHVQLELIPSTTPELVQQLVSHRIDGAFIYAFNDLPREIHVTPLYEKSVTLAVPRLWNWPADTPVSIHCVTPHPIVALSRYAYPGYHDHLFGSLERARVKLNVVQEVNNEAALLSLVSAGVGAALVSSINLNRSATRVVFIPLSDFDVVLPITFAHLSTNINPALYKFLSRTNEILAEGGF